MYLSKYRDPASAEVKHVSELQTIKGSIIKIGKKLALMIGAVSALSFAPAYADTAKDFETLSKAIGFVSGGPSGAVTMDILYDAGNADSAAHADEVAGLTA